MEEEKILNVMREHKELIQSEIPKLAGLDSKTVSIVSRDLENKGFVKRKKVLHQSRWTYKVIYSGDNEKKDQSTYESEKFIEVLGSVYDTHLDNSFQSIEASAGGLKVKIEIPKEAVEDLKIKKNEPIAISLKFNPKMKE